MVGYYETLHSRRLLDKDIILYENVFLLREQMFSA